MGHGGGLTGSQCVSSNEDWVSLNTDEVNRGGSDTLMSLLAVEEADVTDAKPTELLFLFLTDGFWTLRTDETNRYEPVLGSGFYVDKITKKHEKDHNLEQFYS